MASPRDQRLKRIVLDAALPVRERVAALHGMTAPSRPLLRQLIADAATPPQLKANAKRVLMEIEASRRAKSVEQNEQAPQAPQSVPIAAPADTSPASVADLLAQSKARTLADVDYQAVHAYCAARGWSSQAQEVFAEWRKAHFATDEGRAAATEIMRRLREHDFEAWKNAADEWRDSGYKDGRRLIETLERISADPAGVHDEETRTGARGLLEEVRRRCQ